MVDVGVGVGNITGTDLADPEPSFAPTPGVVCVVGLICLLGFDVLSS